MIFHSLGRPPRLKEVVNSVNADVKTRAQKEAEEWREKKKGKKRSIDTVCEGEKR